MLKFTPLVLYCQENSPVYQISAHWFDGAGGSAQM